MGYKLYAIIVKQGEQNYSVSLILGIILVIASLVINNSGISRCLLFLGIFWFLRLSFIFYRLLRLQRNNNKIIQNEENITPNGGIDYQRFTKVLLKQLDSKMKYVVSGLGDIQSKLNVFEERKELEFENEIKSQLYQDLMSEVEVVFAEKENTVDYKEIERIIDSKFGILVDNISKYRKLAEMDKKNQSNNIAILVEGLLNSFKDLKESQQSQLSQVEEMYELSKSEKINFGEINKEIARYVHKYNGFSTESINSLATAVSQERLSDYSLHDISYGGLTTNYTGIFEQEMRIIIALNKKQTAVEELMWKQICFYLSNHSIPILTEHIPDLYRYMEQIHPIRNKVSHGETISREEFMVVKKIAIDKDVFYYMSQAKLGLNNKVTGGIALH